MKVLVCSRVLVVVGVRNGAYDRWEMGVSGGVTEVSHAAAEVLRRGASKASPGLSVRPPESWRR